MQCGNYSRAKRLHKPNKVTKQSRRLSHPKKEFMEVIGPERIEPNSSSDAPSAIAS
jgi:hypothetical protein